MKRAMHLRETVAWCLEAFLALLPRPVDCFTRKSNEGNPKPWTLNPKPYASILWTPWVKILRIYIYISNEFCNYLAWRWGPADVRRCRRGILNPETMCQNQTPKSRKTKLNEEEFWIQQPNSSPQKYKPPSPKTFESEISPRSKTNQWPAKTAKQLT